MALAQKHYDIVHGQRLDQIQNSNLTLIRLEKKQNANC